MADGDAGAILISRRGQILGRAVPRRSGFQAVTWAGRDLGRWNTARAAAWALYFDAYPPASHWADFDD